MGCCWIVPRHGASAFASSEGNISFARFCVAPMSCSTCGSLGWIGVSVMMCQNCVRARMLAESVAHGAAAWYVWPPTVTLVGAIVGSVLCTIFESS